MSEARTSDVSEADRLLATPIVVEHPPGREVELVFTMRAMVEVERQFGSFGEFEDQLNAVLSNRLRAPILTFVVRSFDALLWDDPPGVRENRADALDLRTLGSQVRAILAAWERAWPPAETPQEREDADPNPEAASGVDSRGLAGTTSESSASASTRTASGE